MDALNHTMTFLYAGVKASGVVDPLGHITTFVANTSGQIMGTADPLGHTQAVGYELGDPVTVTDPLGRTATSVFDAAGRGVRMIDGLGRHAVWELDRINQVIKVTDPLGSDTTFTYDENGNLRTVTDAATHTTTYTYNNMNRVETRSDPLQRVESYLYDDNGNLRQVTDRNQQVSTYSYDALDRLTLVTYGDQSTTAYVYDAGDRVREIVDSIAGTITRNYDGLDRLTSETTPEGTVGYTYDNAGRRATMTIPGQPTTSYGYDDADRLTSITQGSSLITFGYDAANRRTSTTLPNGVCIAYTYDAASQLAGITYTQGEATLGTLTYTYDAAGQRIAVGGSFARTALPPALAAATYDAANQIAAWEGTSFTYDGNGNLTSDGSRAYSWNARNQLTAISGAMTGSFSYDGAGRRRAKTFGGASTQFLFDGLNPVQEQVGGSASANMVTRALDEYFTRIDVGGARHFLTDALGNTVALVDANGVVQTSYTFEPFGGTTTTGEPSSNTFAFTGRELDGGGLFFYRARYYDSRLQRFLSEDPLEFMAGTNLHSYVNGDPVNMSDPTGEFGVVGGAIGAGGNLAWQLYRSGGNLGCVNWYQVISWGLTGSGAGTFTNIARSGFTGIGRFFWDTRSYSSIRAAYWGSRGGAGTMSLDHWFFSQAAGRSGAVAPGFVNAGFNLLEMPRGWNTWLGFAPRWIGTTQASVANAARYGIQAGVPTAAGAAGYAGYQIGQRALQNKCPC